MAWTTLWLLERQRHLSGAATFQWQTSALLQRDCFSIFDKTTECLLLHYHSQTEPEIDIKRRVPLWVHLKAVVSNCLCLLLCYILVRLDQECVDLMMCFWKVTKRHSEWRGANFFSRSCSCSLAPVRIFIFLLKILPLKILTAGKDTPVKLQHPFLHPSKNSYLEGCKDHFRTQSGGFDLFPFQTQHSPHISSAQVMIISFVRSKLHSNFLIIIFTTTVESFFTAFVRTLLKLSHFSQGLTTRVHGKWPLDQT